MERGREKAINRQADREREAFSKKQKNAEMTPG
jgi:hypothetical protein